MSWSEATVSQDGPSDKRAWVSRKDSRSTLDRTTSLKCLASRRRAAQVSGNIGQFWMEAPKALCASQWLVVVLSTADVDAPLVLSCELVGAGFPAEVISPVDSPESALSLSSNTSCTLASRSL